MRRFVPNWQDVWTRLSYPDTFWFVFALTGGLIFLSFLVRNRATLRFDLKATLTLQKHFHPVTFKVAKAFTWLGNALTLILLAVGVFIFCMVKEEWMAGIFTLASLLALPINALLKNIFDRERPGENEVKVHAGPRWGFSYPSGHAMGSTALYGALGFLFWILVPDSTIRYSMVGLFFLMPFMISASRIYLGAHWFSDVVGGMAGGLIVVTIIAACYPVAPFTLPNLSEVSPQP